MSNLNRKTLWTWTTTTMVLALLLVVSGCKATVIYRDSFNEPGVGQPPSPPAIGTSAVTGEAVMAANPKDAGSSDRWLRLARTAPTQPGGEYVGTFTEVVKANGSVALVGFIESSSPMMMSV